MIWPMLTSLHEIRETSDFGLWQLKLVNERVQRPLHGGVPTMLGQNNLTVPSVYEGHQLGFGKAARSYTSSNSISKIKFLRYSKEISGSHELQWVSLNLF